MQQTAQLYSFALNKSETPRGAARRDALQSLIGSLDLDPFYSRVIIRGGYLVPRSFKTRTCLRALAYDDDDDTRAPASVKRQHELFEFFSFFFFTYNYNTVFFFLRPVIMPDNSLFLNEV